MYNDDTIAAIATAIGEGGIGIVRISGSDAINIADKLFVSPTGKAPSNQPSQYVAYGHIRDPKTNNVLDEVLLLIMRCPKSYTREDVVEIHCHGGVMPLKKILDLVLKCGARLADPGEFTKRAFLNGRLDLTQAEAVIDVIRSKTDASLRLAMGQLSGAFSDKVKDFRHEILRLVAQLEASIDFPEDDIEDLANNEVVVVVDKLVSKIDLILSTAHTGKILREGLKTVIIGKPNVGKSSLLNALLGETRAIVTDVPGTTRDIIEEYVNLGGIPLKIVDTAGIRETADVVERIGVEKTREMMNEADLLLFLLDASRPLSQEDKEVMALLEKQPALILVNKTDLPVAIDYDEVITLSTGKRVIKLSALEGTGVDEVEKAVAELVYSGRVSSSEGAFVSNVRHIQILEKTREHLAAAQKTVESGMPPDCTVIDLRGAWEKLGEITGDTIGGDIIDHIFTQFCIGK